LSVAALVVTVETVTVETGTPHVRSTCQPARR